MAPVWAGHAHWKVRRFCNKEVGLNSGSKTPCNVSLHVETSIALPKFTKVVSNRSCYHCLREEKTKQNQMFFLLLGIITANVDVHRIQRKCYYPVRGRSKKRV